jgi:hypothetical protein
MGRAMSTVWRVLAGLSLLLAQAGQAAESPAAVGASHQAGQSIYRDGVLATGEPVRATVQKGVPLSGAAAACVNCHRRSGLGGGEGQNSIRPIAGRLLFSCEIERAGRWATPASSAAVRRHTGPAGTGAARGIDPPDGLDALHAALRPERRGDRPACTWRNCHPLLRPA